MKICAKFDLFTVPTPLMLSFDYSNYLFQSKSGILLVVEASPPPTGTEKGLTIKPVGITVNLPAPTNNISFRIGIFASGIVIVSAKNINGEVIATNSYSTDGFTNDAIYVEGELIKSVDFDTDKEEAMLVYICTDI